MSTYPPLHAPRPQVLVRHHRRQWCQHQSLRSPACLVNSTAKQTVPRRRNPSDSPSEAAGTLSQGPLRLVVATRTTRAPLGLVVLSTGIALAAMTRTNRRRSPAPKFDLKVLTVPHLHVSLHSRPLRVHLSLCLPRPCPRSWSSLLRGLTARAGCPPEAKKNSHRNPRPKCS